MKKDYLIIVSIKCYIRKYSVSGVRKLLAIEKENGFNTSRRWVTYCLSVTCMLPACGSWLGLSQAIGSQVRRGSSSGVHPALPVGRKTQLHLLLLSGIEKSEGNYVQKFPQICSQTSTNLWGNVTITSQRKAGRQEKSWPGVSLRVASRNQHVFNFYFLI